MTNNEIIKDRKWSKEVKKNRLCPCCSRKATNAHHIIPRNVKKTRWIIANGFPCCKKLHDKLEANDSLIKEYVNYEYYKTLWKLAYTDMKNKVLKEVV